MVGKFLSLNHIAVQELLIKMHARWLFYLKILSTSDHYLKKITVELCKVLLIDAKVAIFMKYMYSFAKLKNSDFRT